MIRSNASLILGALAGVGLGAGALTLMPRRSLSPEQGVAGRTSSPASSAPEAPAPGVAEHAAQQLREVSSKGFAEGPYQIVDSMRSRVRVFSFSPFSPGKMEIVFAEKPAEALQVPTDELVRHVLGNTEQFLAAYGLASAPRFEGDGVTGTVTYEYRKRGCDGSCPRRSLTFQITTGRLVGVQERASDGGLIKMVKRQGDPGLLTSPKPLQILPARPPMRMRPTLSMENTPSFQEFVSRVPLAIYEPAALPPGFAREDYRFDDRPPSADRAGGKLPIAWISYTDGMLKFHLFLAPPEQMERLQALAAQRDAAPGASTCPTTSAETPEELVADADSIAVHRRSDGCRTVLRRDDLPGVAVALVAYRGVSEDDCVRMIRTLVRVEPKAGDSKAVEPKAEDSASPRGAEAPGMTGK